MIDVRVPDEQEGTKAVVRAWLKKVGEPVAVNDPLVELETDKVTQEVPSPAAGVLAEIAAVVADEAFLDLDAPVARVTMPDIPSPHHPKLMEWALPSPASIRAEIDRLIGF